jgi:hypothetical protein
MGQSPERRAGGAGSFLEPTPSQLTLQGEGGWAECQGPSRRFLGSARRLLSAVFAAALCDAWPGMDLVLVSCAMDHDEHTRFGDEG